MCSIINPPRATAIIETKANLEERGGLGHVALKCTIMRVCLRNGSPCVPWARRPPPLSWWPELSGQAHSGACWEIWIPGVSPLKVFKEAEGPAGGDALLSLF